MGVAFASRTIRSCSSSFGLSSIGSRAVVPRRCGQRWSEEEEEDEEEEDDEVEDADDDKLVELIGGLMAADSVLPEEQEGQQEEGKKGLEVALEDDLVVENDWA